jgi:hypothetical protein
MYRHLASWGSVIFEGPSGLVVADELAAAAQLQRHWSGLCS